MLLDEPAVAGGKEGGGPPSIPTGGAKPTDFCFEDGDAEGWISLKEGSRSPQAREATSDNCHVDVKVAA
jgi:hypothetical protein